jgi:acetylornithine/succinyldiaminopimelate/putrescine aminotransferase
VVSAVRDQTDRLLHAMGDAWPDEARIRLLAALAAAAPPGLTKSLLGLSGADAIDAAIKTARLATGRRGILAFEGGYHGLALGVLGAQGYKREFTLPFADITHPAVDHLPFGAPLEVIDARLARGDVGLVLVEPIQGRGGVREAPEGWLAGLVDVAHRRGAVVAFDEIQCGLGRTGRVWAADHQGATPDLLCTGKALGGGFPISACIGTDAAMDAWGASVGEALHTQTFLGHPIGCAAALAVLAELPALPALAEARGAALKGALARRGFSTRGRGLMLAVPLGPGAFATCRRLQARGFIVLPCGAAGDALCLTPGITLSDAQIDAFADALAEVAA